MTQDERFMSIALQEATKAYLQNEVPVGCVIVDKDCRIISKAYNRREKLHSVFSHAEIDCIKKASKKRKDWQLPDCTIYITLEPCLMCAGAILQSRFKRIVYGTPDFKGGAFGSSINVLEATNINVKPEVIGGVLSQECSSFLTSFFKGKRGDAVSNSSFIKEFWENFPNKK